MGLGFILLGNLSIGLLTVWKMVLVAFSMTRNSLSLKNEVWTLEVCLEMEPMLLLV